MLGAIVEDIVGWVYQTQGWKRKDFPLFVSDSRFTDGTIMTCAVADAILTGSDYREQMQLLGARVSVGRIRRAFFTLAFSAPRCTVLQLR